MLIILKRSYVFLSLVLILTLLCSVTYFGTAKEETNIDYDTIIIDAGHGGQDGGAVGVTGVLEKNINLAIAIKLKDIAKKDGKNVIMTRDTDTDLSTTESSNVRTQKRSDLQNRKNIIEKNNGIFIGIHQNKFEQSKYRGAQVFYANNQEAERLGLTVQKALIDGIADGNTRVAKKSEKDIYILKGIKSPAIIVECGFLSNPEEEKLLTQNDYQTKVAQAIYDGICRYKE